MWQHYQTVYIKASKEEVWDILVDVENWSQWDKEVKSAVLDQPFAVGAKGILISKDGKGSTFVITAIKQYKYYCNYYFYPFWTKLQFTHEIEEWDELCRVTFIASFTGILGWYFALRQGDTFRKVMCDAMSNLVNWVNGMKQKKRGVVLAD